MSRPSALRALAGAIVAAVLVGAAASLQAVREVRYPGASSSQRVAVPDVRSDRATSVRSATPRWPPISTGSGRFSTTAATRIRADQPAARQRAQNRLRLGRDFDLLYPLLDLTTTLDPRFNIAYRFGSIFLAEPPPGGAGRPDLAIALLEKGLRERPDKWEYMQDIGFVHYWWRRDYPGCRAVVRQSEQGARRALVPAIARGGDACGRWRPAVVAHDVDGHSGIGGDRLAQERRRTTTSATRRR